MIWTLGEHCVLKELYADMHSVHHQHFAQPQEAML